MHHYYMERLTFCALIKHMFKTDLQKDEISCAKYFINVHMQTFALKCNQKIWDKKISSLKLNPVPGRVFWTFERQRVLFDPRQKNCYKSCLLHLNHFTLGTAHLWTLKKMLILVTWSKWWRQYHFWWRHHSTTIFFVFQIIPLPKINCFFLEK